MATDPVCKMIVSEEKAPERVEYKGVTYFFCAAGCRERFENNPAKYLSDEPVDWVKD